LHKISFNLNSAQITTTSGRLRVQRTRYRSTYYCIMLVLLVGSKFCCVKNDTFIFFAVKREYRILLEAGLPPGVINFVPADGPKFGSVITREPTLAGINYTGSTQVFKILLKAIAQNMDLYNTYPRIVGECGGKNYHFVHPSANTADVALATLRSAFEYTGQKCSACSRLYVPASLWPKIRDMLVELMSKVKVGSPLEKDTFTSAVIDSNAFKKISGYIEYAKGCNDLQLIAGGGCDDSVGYYIQPTLYKTNDPRNKLMLVPEIVASTALTVLAHSLIAWAYSVRGASMTAEYTTMPTTPIHNAH
uniref:L-glutamate gamma-semialdehyde dehydrogenase n=1 Tax=Schistocephalus solidus TaxID=70667 RepID=A0A183TNT1_SCHSO